MKRNKLYCLILILMFCLKSYAQESIASALYDNMNIIGSSHAGIDEKLKFTLNFKSQAVRLRSTPEIWHFSSSVGVPQLRGGIGLGMLTNNSVYALNKVDFDVKLPYGLLLRDSIEGKQAGEMFGISVDLNSKGNRVAVGAPMSKVNGKNSGQVRIFELHEGKWVRLGGNIKGKNAGDFFGGIISLNSEGTRVAVGALIAKVNGKNSGQVRVFEFDGDKWVQLGGDIDGKNVGECFGGAISLNSDGTRIAIGAPYSDEDGKSSGRVSAYRLHNKKWVQMGNDIKNVVLNEGAQLGSSISFNSDGSRLAVGTPFYNGKIKNSGQTKVMEWRNGNWEQLGNPIYGTGAYDMFGISVSLSLDGYRLAVVTTPMENNDEEKRPGKVQVFELINNKWKALGSDIYPDLANTLAGSSVDFGSNGEKLAIGIMPSGINTERNRKSGKIQTYFLVNDDWALDTTYNGNIYGPTSLSLSQDSKSVAIGAPFNSGENGAQSGQVHIISMEK